MQYERLIDSANALVAALGIVDPRDKLTQVSEHDARRWVAKTFRELRHAIAVGAKVDVDKVARGVAEHLADQAPAISGKTTAEMAASAKASATTWEKAVAALVPKVKDAITAEKKLFEAHVIEHGKALGEHAVFHEDHGFIDARKYDDNQFPLSARLNKAAFAGSGDK